MASATPFSSDKVAGGLCETCGDKAPASERAGKSTANANRGPCDLNSLTLTLQTPFGTVSKTGTRQQASLPINGLSQDLNLLLQSHSVVIHRVSTATLGVNQLQGAYGSAGGSPAIPVGGTASARAQMKSNCGSHPEMFEEPKPDTPDKAGKLSVSTTEWQVSDFGKMMFAGKSVDDLVFGDRASKIFDADSCGRPASGDPVISLSGIAQIAIADEWDITLLSGKGIELNLSFSGTASAEYSRGDGYSGSATNTVLKAESSYESVGASRKKTLEASSGTDAYHSVEHSAGVTTIIDSQKTESKISASSESRDTFLEEGRRKILATVQDSFTFKVARNGKSVFDPSEIVKSLKKFGEELGAVFARIGRLKELFDRGARFALPASIAFELSFSLTLLKGSVRARFWPEKREPKVGASYHIEDFATRFQAVVDLLLAKIEVKPKITGMASLYSEYIASLKVEIEGSVSGAANLAYNIDDGTTLTVIQANAHIPMSISAVGTGSAVSFYVMASASAQSALRYTWAATYDAMTMSAAKHRITNDRLECSIVVKRGNKIAEFFGFGEAKEWISWPKDGPFVWIESDAMEQSW